MIIPITYEMPEINAVVKYPCLTGPIYDSPNSHKKTNIRNKRNKK